MLARKKLNNLLDSREIEEICRLSPQDAEFLENAIQKLWLSIRAWHRILRVSRTIADLGAPAIERNISSRRSVTGPWTGCCRGLRGGQ